MINRIARDWKYALKIACIFGGLFLFCGLAFASGGGEHAGAHDSGQQMTDLLYRCLNFALLLIILIVLIRKTSLRNFFSNRREEIRKTFDDLKAEREAVEARYQELEEKLEEFEHRKKDIIEQFREDGAAEKARIIDEARKKAEHILAQADQTIEREIHAARDRIKGEVIDIAADRAEAIITEKMMSEDQDNMVDEFIKKLEKLH